MQKISFGNREYVKASEVAKHFKYTQDYVGQLCRADKVDARLVGRVWYVNLDSVTEYRKTKHSTQKTAAKAADEGRMARKRSQVEPVVRAKTARKLQEVFPSEAHSAVKQMTTKYSRDKVSIIPVLDSSVRISKSESASVPKSKPKITIKVRPDSRKSTRYHAEKMPEITLQAKIKVTDKIDSLESKSEQETKPNTRNTNSVNIAPTNAAPEKTANFQPASIANQTPSVAVDRKVNKNKSRHSRVVFWSAVALILSAFLLAFFSLGVEYYVEFGVVNPTSGLSFDLTLVIEKLSEIAR